MVTQADKNIGKQTNHKYRVVQAKTVNHFKNKLQNYLF